MTNGLNSWEFRATEEITGGEYILLFPNKSLQHMLWLGPGIILSSQSEEEERFLSAREGLPLSIPM